MVKEVNEEILEQSSQDEPANSRNNQHVDSDQMIAMDSSINSVKKSREKSCQSELMQVKKERGHDDLQGETELIRKEHLRRLTQSLLDLEWEAETGTEFFSSCENLRKNNLKKYSPALKTFLPIRGKSSKTELPLSSLGCLNFAISGWVTPIILRIYRHGIDTVRSIYLSDQDSAKVSAHRMERLWKEELKRRGPEGASLKRVLLLAFRTRLILTFFFTALFVFFSLFNPIYLIRSFLDYLAEGDVDIGIGLAYVFSMLFCEVFRAVFISMSWVNNYHAGVRIRAGAMTLLFHKILRLKGMKDKTVGELVNLAGNDGQRIYEAIAVGPLAFSGPVAMLAGCAYAVYYLGPWALVGCGVFVGFYPFSTFISRLTTYLRKKSILITDSRVRMMNELLTCIKLIKMYAWEKPFANKIADIRHEERKVLEKGAILQSISTGTTIMIPIIASTCTFIAMTTAGNNLSAAQAFSFLSLLNSMRFVLAVLPYGVKAIAEASVAVSRYQSVLLMEEMKPHKGEKPKDHVAIEFVNACLSWSNAINLKPHIADKKVENNVQKSVSKESVIGVEENEKQTMLSDITLSVMAEQSVVQDLVLKNITFSLEKGKLLGVCGSVGCGKSSLINAVLGRMEQISGSIGINGTIAYVPQQAWIMNATARENILFGLPFDKEKYNKTVEACALNTDFDTFISGDLTEIGERGINLSGGQKQRISLARAVYSDSEIYLLDDPLSAVDIHVGRHIFSQCIMGALSGRAVVFVTHQLEYLKHCHEIIFLKDSHIVGKGSHTELVAQSGEYAALMQIYYKERLTELVEIEEEDQQMEEYSSSPQQQHHHTTSISSSVDEQEKRVSFVRALSIKSSASIAVEELQPKAGQFTDSATNGDREAESVGKLISVEKTQLNIVKGRTVLDYMKASGGYCTAITSLLTFFLAVTAQNSANVFLMYWLNQGSGNTSIFVGNETVISHSISDHPMLSIYTAIFGSTIIAMISFLLIRSVIFMKVTLTAASKLHDDAFGKILRCPMTFFDSTPLGRIINRFSSDMDEVDVRLPMSVEVFISNVLHIIFSLGLIAYVTPYFLIALVPLLASFIIIFKVFTGSIGDLKQLDMVSRSPLISHITASVQGISTIHAYKKTSFFLQKYCELLDVNSVPFVLFFIANRWLALRLDFISSTVTGITAFIIVLTYKSITPAMAGLAISSALQMTGLFQFTIRLAIESEARFTSVQRVLEYSKTIKPEAPAIIMDKRPPENWPKEGHIAYMNVRMRYREGMPLVLKDVSFNVNAREKIGIVGRSGSGKSSLGVVLFRLVELSHGKIVIDGVDIGTLGLEDLRSKLAIIPQDPVLFVGTIRYNLDPFKQYDDEELWLALEKCNIKNSIAQLELKLDALVLENGENFSVGERQLLCMARALLRHSKILILDEATAAVDTETDELIQNTLKKAFWDCTMLIIAHRLNTVLSCDKILVMDDGKVAEFDRPSILMSRPDSLFRTMLEAAQS